MVFIRYSGQYRVQLERLLRKIFSFSREYRSPCWLEEIPPHVTSEESICQKLRLSTDTPGSISSSDRPRVPEPPPNTEARAPQPFTMSAKAAPFELATPKREASFVPDKVPIHGLMSSSRFQKISQQKRRISDAEVGHLFHRLSRSNVLKIEKVHKLEFQFIRPADAEDEEAMLRVIGK
ncbi:hypothetical protein K432DRAFT_394891 [Lepidopterella palustris CBS 459.81]|uniref:Uncharacterized protein n=1 Tax=Lepidopterella palustris CBS 459.81 TaxID=1314670 RepID=A0A8E2JDB3_9PEZI|nr:hypothetical protein K432DRAFT_394891 [Lepidopterella palustris CBS 459.81]